MTDWTPRPPIYPAEWNEPVTELFDKPDDEVQVPFNDPLPEYVKRIRALDDEIKELNEMKKELRGEMKGKGICMKSFAKLYAMLKLDPKDRATTLEYMRRMGIMD